MNPRTPEDYELMASNFKKLAKELKLEDVKLEADQLAWYSEKARIETSNRDRLLDRCQEVLEEIQEMKL